ncbi:hypothetical protein FN846DRAFT_921434 [Sphaerosporella brunnea]|uniref:Uncharacterized protein n=1 Tax=Sphaerosporella brunnea TaxID=1250544 RepID=A0A5J5ENM7_9PEZI|nr:hypothetical protein FN846DRAFT_921434 [Sphaerosporella brunnea]
MAAQTMPHSAVTILSFAAYPITPPPIPPRNPPRAPLAEVESDDDDDGTVSEDIEQRYFYKDPACSYLDFELIRYSRPGQGDEDLNLDFGDGCSVDLGDGKIYVYSEFPRELMYEINLSNASDEDKALSPESGITQHNASMSATGAGATPSTNLTTPSTNNEAQQAISYSATTHSSARKHPESFWDIALRAKRTASSSMDSRAETRNNDGNDVFKTTTTGFQYRSVAATEYGTPTATKPQQPETTELQDVNNQGDVSNQQELIPQHLIKSNARGFKYHSVAADWEELQKALEEKLPAQSAQNTTQKSSLQQQAAAATSPSHGNQKKGSTRLRGGIAMNNSNQSASKKGRVRSRNTDKDKSREGDSGGGVGAAGVPAAEKQCPFKLGLPATDEDAETKRRRRRAARFGNVKPAEDQLSKRGRYRHKPY